MLDGITKNNKIKDKFKTRLKSWNVGCRISLNLVYEWTTTKQVYTRTILVIEIRFNFFNIGDTFVVLFNPNLMKIVITT